MDALLVPAVIGLGFLIGSVVLFVMVLWKKSFARAIGGARSRVVVDPRLVRKPPVDTWGEGAVRFRKQTISWSPAGGLRDDRDRRQPPRALVRAAPRASHVGVSAHEVSTIQVLAVFAFVGLISAIPITGRRGRRGALVDRWSLRRGEDPRGCPTRGVQGPGDGGRALVPDVDVRGPDPAGGLLPDLARKKSWRKPQPEPIRTSTVTAGLPVEDLVRHPAPFVFGLVFCLGTACTADTRPTSSQQVIQVAAFSFTESEILAELYSQALRARGFPTDRW